MKQMIEVNKERFWNTLHHQNVFTRITGEYPYVTEFRRSDRLLVGKIESGIPYRKIDARYYLMSE